VGPVVFEKDLPQTVVRHGLGLIPEQLGGGLGMGGEHQNPQVRHHGDPPWAESQRDQAVKVRADLLWKQRGIVGGEAP
jgi:hypothetical protein